jgi:4-diphosphocytidyl-2-C-methyl-D-erythritol kinase
MPLLDADMLVETAYAKVNLALHVRERRADGYHALESLFSFARDGDLLAGEVTEDGSITLTLDGPFADVLEAGEGNLVMKAARLLQEQLDEKRGAAIRLTKNLPVASGIGGGSADAAAALRLLNRLWGAQLPTAELERFGLMLGSDVPACISSVTQMVRGRGEVLEQREVQGLAGMPMLLVNPGVALSTAQVFKGWDQQDRGPLDAGTLEDVVVRGRNDLEPPAIQAAPIIAEVLALLHGQAGVELARMSGSGATCFALFDQAESRSTAAKALAARRPGWWIMETEIGGA